MEQGARGALATPQIWKWRGSSTFVQLVTHANSDQWCRLNSSQVSTCDLLSALLSSRQFIVSRSPMAEDVPKIVKQKTHEHGSRNQGGQALYFFNWGGLGPPLKLTNWIKFMHIAIFVSHHTKLEHKTHSFNSQIYTSEHKIYTFFFLLSNYFLQNFDSVGLCEIFSTSWHFSKN